MGPDNVRPHSATQFLLGNTASINFYVCMDGTVQSLSYCEQDMSASGHLLGGSIVYFKQRASGALDSRILQDVAKFLQSCGYHGLVGIDVMLNE